MGGESDTPEAASASKQPNVIGIVGGIIAILVGLNALTGFNPLKDFIGPKPSPSVAPIPGYEAPPMFSVASSNFTGPCQESRCSATAIIRNRGGAGEGIAVFHVIAVDGKEPGTELASCSAAIPRTLRGSTATVGCTAYSSQLSKYFTDNPGGTVRMRVEATS